MYRGAPPDTNDYNSCVDFPPHQLMQPTQNNFSSQPQYRPPPQPPTPQVLSVNFRRIYILFKRFGSTLSFLYFPILSVIDYAEWSLKRPSVYINR